MSEAAATPRTQYRDRDLSRVRLGIVLAVFALLLGTFVARCLVPYRSAEQPMEWSERALWIAPPSPSAVAYYRTELWLAAAPDQAYLQLAAPDGFVVYVNGKPLGSSTLVSATRADLIDLGSALEVGRNVIAVRVERQTYPGAPALRAQAVWREENGTSGAIFSNGSWRTARQGQRQLDSQLAWYERDFDDRDWPAATPLGESIGSLRPVHPWATPELFTVFPRGEWIWSDRPATQGVVFRRQFDIGSEPVLQAWVGVATQAPYTLLINRIRTLPAPATAEFMDVYDLGPFLARGINTIEIDTSSLGRDSKLAVAAWVKTPAGVQDLSSDARWQTRTGDDGWRAAGRLDGVRSLPLTVNRRVASAETRVPVLRLSELPLPGGLILRRTLGALLWSAGILTVSLVAVALVGRRRRLLHQALSLPAILASLMLASAFLLSLDVRVHESRIFTLPTALAVALLTAIWCGLIAWEGRHEHA